MSREAAKSSNIFSQYLSWHFYDAPKGILEAWGNFLKFNLRYFSVWHLLKTLLSPWKRHLWSSGRGFNLTLWLKARISNLFSRLTGAVARMAIIIVGVFIELLIAVLGLALFIVWIVLPVLIVMGLYLSINFLI